MLNAISNVSPLPTPRPRAASGCPAGTGEPLDTTSLWQEAPAPTRDARLVLADEGREKLTSLLRLLEANGVRFGVGSASSLVGRVFDSTVAPETLATLLAGPGDNPCWVEGPDFSRRPLDGLGDVRILDALYGTRNTSGLPLATLAVTLDHLAGLGCGLSLKYATRTIDEHPGRLGVYRRYESHERLDHTRDHELKYSCLQISDSTGTPEEIYYEADVRAVAYFKYGAPEAVLGKDAQAGRGLQAFASHGFDLHANTLPSGLNEKKFWKVPIEKAWADLHNAYKSEPVYVTSPHCAQPQELTLSYLDSWHPIVMDAAVALCPTQREAEQIYVEGEGLWPGHDLTASVDQLEDLHHRVRIAGSPAVSWVKNPSLATAAWAYQVVHRGLVAHPEWAGALDAMKQYVLDLGPHSTQESFKQLQEALGEEVKDAKAMTAFFGVAGASGTIHEGLARYRELKKSPEKIRLAAMLLSREKVAAVARKARWAEVDAAEQTLEECRLGDEGAPEALARLERIFAAVPSGETAPTLHLYRHITEALRDGAWKGCTFENAMLGLDRQLLFTTDPDELRRRLTLEDARAVPARVIERHAAAVVIGGVRIGVRLTNG